MIHFPVLFSTRLQLVLFCFLCVSAPFFAAAQRDTVKKIALKELTVTASLASSKMPLAFANVDKQTLRQNDFGQDVPYLLQMTPSVVASSDAGTGFGYTGIRIRGTDATRINVTIDDVPINEAETQIVYWVDLPDFVASVDQIQIQRGVGTSTNGAGAFGGSINLSTKAFHPDRYVSYSGTAGAFNTLKNTLSFGSGVLANRLILEARLSKLNSDGYIQRGSSDLASAYFSGLYFTDKSSIRLNAFTGKEITYQAWGGVPAQYIGVDSLRNFNPLGTEKPGAPYKNQIDHYVQSHVHIAAARQFSDRLNGVLTLHYTKGAGYYEEYKAAQSLAPYNLGAPTDTSDLVRRLWLNSDFYGAVYSLSYKDARFESVAGGAWNNYISRHFGEVTQLINPGAGVTNIPPGTQPYYSDNNHKNDFNVYAKTTFQASPVLNLFMDLQYRRASYALSGTVDGGRNLNFKVPFNFFNPKLGLSYTPDPQNLYYLSFAVANREPNRDDYVAANENALPRSERLYDLEAGYKYQAGPWKLGANGYYMSYKDQLGLTGQINDVGAPIHANIPVSDRLGLELEAAVRISGRFRLNANLTLSRNQIKNFTEYVDNWDKGSQDTFYRGNTPIAFSPSLISALETSYDLIKNKNQTLTAALSNKWVSRQYIDNAGNENTSLPAYDQTDVKVIWSIKKINKWGFKDVSVKLLISNLFDRRFSTNAWTYRYISASDYRADNYYTRSEGANVYNQTGYFPQALRAGFLSVSFSL